MEGGIDGGRDRGMSSDYMEDKWRLEQRKGGMNQK